MRWVWLVLWLGMGLACTPSSDTRPAEPRLVGEATLPPATVTPLVLGAPTATSTPAALGNEAPTATQEPSPPRILVTLTPPDSPTPTATDTATRTPIPTATRTPTPSRTPTATASPPPTQTPLQLPPPDTSPFVATVARDCAPDWFFTPAPPTCPTAPARSIPAAYQTMQRGLMLWLSDARTIFVLFNDGQSPAWLAAEDTYTEGEALNLAEPPPAGLLAPQRGFGKLWGSNRDLQTRLGWATNPEIAYMAQYQTSERGQYVTNPQGRILGLLDGGARWEQLR